MSIIWLDSKEKVFRCLIKIFNRFYLKEVKKAKNITPYVNIVKIDQSMMLVQFIRHIKVALSFLNKEINNGMDGGVGL